MNTSKCKWCGHQIKGKRNGRPARYCSASCRQRAYERRLLEKQKQAEADAANAALPRCAHVKPTLPPRPPSDAAEVPGLQLPVRHQEAWRAGYRRSWRCERLASTPNLSASSTVRYSESLSCK